MSGRGHGPPEISVILPVLNGSATLEAALAAIQKSTFKAFEIIVVDDGSTDATPDILKRHGVARVIKNPEPRGPFFCRNQAADQARGEILFFTDADVEIAADTLERAARHVQAGPDRAVIGLYGLRHPHANLASLYKNAWIHHTYREAAGRVDWFFTAVGAVRKTHFEAAGRFDGRAGNDSGEDIAFGHRLVKAGSAVALDPALEVVHRKRYTLAGLLANDFRRGHGYVRMALRLRREGRRLGSLRIANVSRGFALSTLSAWIAVLAGAASLQRPWLVGVAVGALVTDLGLNAKFLNLVRRRISWGACLGMAPVMVLDHLAAGLGAAAGFLDMRG